tara:strand:+ start:3063 stop:5366 length:2304 start_codon:yes stop_codon:yes gene_type:complete
MSNTVNINTNNNIVTVNQGATEIISVSTPGPRGVNGPAGPAGSIDSGSFATTGSNVFIGDQTITGSLLISGSSTFTNIGPAIFSGSTTITGSLNITGSLTISGSGDIITSEDTGSFVTNSQTSSFVTNSQTGSFATTGSNSFTGSLDVSGSLTITGSLTVSGSGTLNNIGPLNQTGESLFIGNVTASGDVLVSQFIKHAGDVNTLINFTDNRIRFKAGDIGFFDMEKDSDVPYPATINPGGNRVNFRVNDRNTNLLLKTDSELFKVNLYYAGNQKLETAVDGIKISGNISASGNITASGNISASGDLIGNGLSIGGSTGLIEVFDDAFILNLASGSAGGSNQTLRSSNKNLLVNSGGGFDTVKIQNAGLIATSITASGAISASGAINGQQIFGGVLGRIYPDSSQTSNNQFFTADTKGINSNSSFTVTGNVTASNNISASGDIVANNLSGTNTGDQDLSNLVPNAQTASFAITGSNVLFGNITASGNISASGTVVGATFGDSSGNIVFSGNVSGSGTNSSYFGAEYHAHGNDANSGFTILSLTNKPIISANNSKLLIGGIVEPEIPTKLNSNNVEFAGAITASSNISASGNILLGTEIFTNGIKTLERYTNGNLEIGNLNDEPQNYLGLYVGGDFGGNAIYITASNGNVGLNTSSPTERLTVAGNISASGDIIANKVTADVVDTSFETFLNFEAATAFTFIAPFPMTINFTGSSTSSMDLAGFVTASANTSSFSSQQVIPITLNRFDKLKITPSSSGLFTLSGSRII